MPLVLLWQSRLRSVARLWRPTLHLAPATIIPMASGLPKALAQLIPITTYDATTTIFPHPTTLYRTLSRLPKDGVGARVTQRRWAAKGIEGSYWEVTRIKLKPDGQHGKAWGKLVWKGSLTTVFKPLFIDGCCQDKPLIHEKSELEGL